MCNNINADTFLLRPIVTRTLSETSSTLAVPSVPTGANVADTSVSVGCSWSGTGQTSEVVTATVTVIGQQTANVVHLQTFKPKFFIFFYGNLWNSSCLHCKTVIILLEHAASFIIICCSSWSEGQHNK